MSWQSDKEGWPSIGCRCRRLVCPHQRRLPLLLQIVGINCYWRCSAENLRGVPHAEMGPRRAISPGSCAGKGW